MTELDLGPSWIGYALALVAFALAAWAWLRERRTARLAAKRKAMEERAMAAAYGPTPPGALFDIAGGIRRQVATRILTGQDPPV